jgi:hypothetical protein
MKHELRWCADIGMLAFDRPINDLPGTGIKGSCTHRTSFCNATCYNMKLYKLYKNMSKRDVRCEQWWQQITGTEVASVLSKLSKTRDTSRVRFMTRGEALKDAWDIARVKDICTACPGTLFWLPTRAWRNVSLRTIIEQELMPLPNLALNASLDPSNTDAEWKSLISTGWSTMFYGDNSRAKTPNGQRTFQCPKTFKQLSGHCLSCKAGCLGSRTTYSRRTDVLLKKH